MKKILLSIIYLLACIFSIYAQTLYGTTSRGGSGGGGTINKFMPATNDLTVAKSFEGLPFFAPGYTNFLQASNGKLYGVTPNGTSGYGNIFSFDPSTSTYTNLMDFHNANGGYPSGALIQASDGKLYGMTIGGGGTGQGVMYSFDPTNSLYTKLMDFDSIGAGQAYGSLVQASDGKLYGMTNGGGRIGYGVIFSFDLSNSSGTKLMDFDNINGGMPMGSLIQASDGRLYGTTSGGGSGGYGVIFSFDPSASTYIKLFDFDNINGNAPYGRLLQATDGKLYGMTVAGGNNSYGVIFSFEPSVSTFTKLKDFDYTQGAGGYGSLVQATDGNLYGMTAYGGSAGAGTVFSFDPFASIYVTLKDFDLSDGGGPLGSLIQASDGNLYGMTNGQAVSVGVIFSIDLSSSKYTKLKNFLTNENGSNVSGSLASVSDGKLYGLTSKGGSSGLGVIFSFDPAALTYTKLKDFDTADGGNPNGSLIQASNGKLYGLTSGGGRGGAGVIFSYDPSTSIYSKLKDFDYSIDGGYADGSLLQASDGKLYGITRLGGTNGLGVIFSFDPTSSVFTKLVDFDNTNGGGGSGSLIQANDGMLYGMTGSGGNGLGVIFSFNPANSTITKLMDFDNDKGAFPVGSLFQGSDGKLYGTTPYGGSGQAGVFFSFDLSSSTYTNLKDFDGNNGGNPVCNLMQASDGKLYGMTGGGGSSSAGVIFSYDLSSSIYTKLIDYNGDNGANPPNGAAFIEIKKCMSKTYYRDADCDGYGNPDCKVMSCTCPTGYVTDNTDCDDNNKAVHAPVTYYRDYDRDGFGDPYHPITACNDVPPAGYQKNNYDCYDGEGASEPGYVKIRMCHDGWTQCVYVKDTAEKLSLGWTIGLCPLQSCGSDETLMCHNGKQECVKTTDVAGKLAEPGGKWSLGPYCSGVPISKPGSNRQRKIELAGREKSLPKQYSLSNQPNPFAGRSTIKYELPLDSKVSIKVYDVAGRAVATLVDEYKKAGIYTVNFNATSLSSGSLFYKIIAKSKDGQYEQTNQMIKIK